MKSNSKKKINPISVILGIIAALFLIYGVYMVIYSVDYVMSYGQNSVSTENAIQYVVTSSMAYFGFCGVFFTGACILQSLTDMKRHLAGNFQMPMVDMKEIVVEKPEYIEEKDDDEASSGTAEKTNHTEQTKQTEQTDQTELTKHQEPDEDSLSENDEQNKEENTYSESSEPDAEENTPSESREPDKEENTQSENYEPDKEEQPPVKNQQEPIDRISSSFIKNIFEEKNQ